MELISLRDFKNQMDDLLQKVQYEHRRYVIKKRSTSAVALISAEDLQLFERLEQSVYIQHAKQGIELAQQQGVSDVVGVDKNTPYHLLAPPPFAHSVDRLNKKDSALFFEHINAIAINPHLEGAVKVKGMLGLRQFKLGDYILLYKIEEKKPAVTLLALVDRASL